MQEIPYMIIKRSICLPHIVIVYPELSEGKYPLGKKYAHEDRQRDKSRYQSFPDSLPCHEKQYTINTRLVKYLLCTQNHNEIKDFYGSSVAKCLGMLSH